MNVNFLNPSELGRTFGWSHLVTVSGGTTIHISGQVAVNERGEVVGKGDLRLQTEQAFRNIEIALKSANATWEHVVKTNLYVVGLKPEHVPIIREIRGRYVSAEHPPVSTLVGVTALVGPDWLIEIEATAAIP
jgi:enamine deaminase RidA (YjgF/YER057c/UK114 family)